MEKENKISRRQALKRMGTLVVGAAISTTLFSSFAKPSTVQSKGKVKRLVFYFTATGNSLFVARSIAGNEGELLSIPQQLKKNTLEFEADEIGFVFPDFAASAPMIVREFVSKAKLKAPYMFSVITYGNFAANVAEWWVDFCKKQGMDIHYSNTLLMVDNYLPVFDMNEQVKIDKHIPENLSKITSDLNEQKHFIARFEQMNEQMQGFLTRLQDEHFSITADKLLKINAEACIACGTCVSVCPRNNFHLTETIAAFSGACEYCLACVHNCPEKALTLARGERNPQARFRHDQISLSDIIQSNNQQ